MEAGCRCIRAESHLPLKGGEADEERARDESPSLYRPSYHGVCGNLVDYSESGLAARIPPERLAIHS